MPGAPWQLTPDDLAVIFEDAYVDSLGTAQYLRPIAVNLPWGASYPTKPALMRFLLLILMMASLCAHAETFYVFDVEGVKNTSFEIVANSRVEAWNKAISTHQRDRRLGRIELCYEQTFAAKK